MGIPITGLDQLGFVQDVKPYTLPPNAWSDVRNVRFIDDSVYPTYGHAGVLGVPQIVPYYVHGTLDVGLAPLFAYCGLAKAWATDGTTHVDITRLAGGDYAATENDLWSAVEFGGISIFNNGVDVPQAWIGRQISQPLVNLANWPANTTAKIVRAYRRFLFAFDVTVSGTRFPTLAKWSHEADPGTVPSTWDPADETKDAGEYPLIDTAGEVLEALPLGDVMCVYKSDAMYLARYIGGTFVFDLPLQFRDFGILSQRCVGEWQKKHIVLSNASDLFISDGFQYKPILERRMRRWLGSRIDSANAFKSFVVINHVENEAWVCFPENGSTLPSIALIVNLNTGAAAPRDLPLVSHIEYTKTPTSTGSTFDSISTPFDDMVGYFGQSLNSLAKKRLVGCVPAINRNILLQTDTLDNASWAKTRTTVTANADGTLDKIIPNAVNDTHYIQQIPTKTAESQTWSFSCVAKASGYSGAGLLLIGAVGNSAEVWWSLLDGSVSFSGMLGGFSGLTFASELVGTEWHLRMTCNTDNAATLVGIIRAGLNAATFSFAGNTVDGILVGAVQLRQGSPGTYQATTTVAARSAFFLFDSGFDFDGVAFSAYAERIGLAVTGQNFDKSLRVDPTIKSFFQQVWPKVQMINGSSVGVMAGGQEFPDGPIDWTPIQQFNPDVDLFVEINKECRYKSVRFQSDNREMWRLTEYDLELANIGKF